MFLFLIKVLFIIIELGMIAFLVVILWHPLKNFTTYSSKEKFEVVVVCLITLAILFGTGMSFYWFFFSEGMSHLIPFFCNRIATLQL